MSVRVRVCVRDMFNLDERRDLIPVAQDKQGDDEQGDQTSADRNNCVGFLSPLLSPCSTSKENRGKGGCCLSLQYVLLTRTARHASSMGCAAPMIGVSTPRGFGVGYRSLMLYVGHAYGRGVLHFFVDTAPADILRAATEEAAYVLPLLSR